MTMRGAPHPTPRRGNVTSGGNQSRAASSRRTEPELRYVLDAKPVYEALRAEMVQLAAFLLTRLTANGRRIVDPAHVENSQPRLAEARQGLGELRPPASAAHHYWHMQGAQRALERAETAALSRADCDRDALFHRLEEAEAHLRAASRALPGFALVDLSQACCAAHAGSSAQAWRCSG
jgi:hypothetical protein